MKTSLFILLGVLLICPLGYAQEITIGTEDFPPYSYLEDGRMKGLSTEVVQAVLKEVGITAKINIYPWARAYKLALQRQNHLLFSVLKTQEREALFKWVGTISPYNIYFYKLKTRDDIRITSLEDAKQYATGSVQNDVKVQYLKSKGFDNIQHVSKDDYNIAKLIKGRVDIIPYDELGFTYKVKQLGYDISQFEKGYFIADISKDLWMAFNINTADDLVSKFRNALEKIKKDGTYDQIRSKYLK